MAFYHRSRKAKDPAHIRYQIVLQNEKNNNLPFPSVKSRIPPPTVSGTKTFSEV